MMIKWVKKDSELKNKRESSKLRGAKKQKREKESEKRNERKKKKKTSKLLCKGNWY